MTRVADSERAAAESGVSVIIPTYQRADLLARVIDPLLSDPATGEVVVVVDGSTDASMQILERMARADDRVVPVFIENSGQFTARLCGVRRACADVVVVLDDDVEPAPGLVSHHAQHHRDREDLLVVGYMPVADPSSAAARLYAEAYEAHVGALQRRESSVLRTLWTGNFSIRRRPFLEAAQRPVRYPYAYHEDQVLGFGCEAIGLTGIYDPSARALHHYERTLAGMRRDARNQGRAHIWLAQEFPALAPAVPPDAFSRYTVWWLAWIVALSRRPRFDRLSRPGIASATAALDRIGAAKAVRLAGLLAALEQQRGAIEASADLLGTG